MGAAGVSLRVFASALIVAAVSAALWCRDWRLALPATVLLALFLAASAAWRFSVVGGLCGALPGLFPAAEARTRHRLRGG